MCVCECEMCGLVGRDGGLFEVMCVRDVWMG